MEPPHLLPLSRGRAAEDSVAFSSVNLRDIDLEMRRSALSEVSQEITLAGLDVGPAKMIEDVRKLCREIKCDGEPAVTGRAPPSRPLRGFGSGRC